MQSDTPSLNCFETSRQRSSEVFLLHWATVSRTRWALHQVYIVRLRCLRSFRQKHYISVHDLKWKEMPAPVREPETSRRRTIFGFQPGSFLHSSRRAWILIDAFYHLLWKRLPLRVNDRKAVNLLYYHMSRRHFSQREREREDLFEHKSRRAEGEAGRHGWIICPFRFAGKRGDH